MTKATTFPLCWPHGVPRTAYPRKDPFGKATYSIAKPREELVLEVEKLHARTLVISCNLIPRLDGRVMADAKLSGADAGVALYFTHPARGEIVIACDKWRTVSGNTWAIRRVLGNLRENRRWINDTVADQAIGGFAGALPHITPEAPWWVVLEFSETQAPDATIEDVEKKARDLSKRYHPDSALGGDAERFKSIRAALDKARAERGVGVA